MGGRDGALPSSVNPMEERGKLTARLGTPEPELLSTSSQGSGGRLWWCGGGCCSGSGRAGNKLILKFPYRVFIPKLGSGSMSSHFVWRSGQGSLEGNEPWPLPVSGRLNTGIQSVARGKYFLPSGYWRVSPQWQAPASIDLFGITPQSHPPCFLLLFHSPRPRPLLIHPSEQALCWEWEDNWESGNPTGQE